MFQGSNVGVMHITDHEDDLTAYNRSLITLGDLRRWGEKNFSYFLYKIPTTGIARKIQVLIRLLAILVLNVACLPMKCMSSIAVPIPVD